MLRLTARSLGPEHPVVLHYPGEEAVPPLEAGPDGLVLDGVALGDEVVFRLEHLPEDGPPGG